jgi:phosphoesterase RecJ-like protein
MTDNVKKLAPVVLETINKSTSVLMHCHPGPDPDSIGTTLAMKFGLEQIGKKVTLIIGDSEVPSSAEFLPGNEKIIKKNFFEVDFKDFDLFLILDTSSPNQISKKGEVTIPQELNTVIIDHHISNTKFAKINLVDSDYPATAQIVYDLMKLWGWNISPEMATNLFAGMYTDTGGFKYAPANESTFLAAAELVRISPNFTETIFNIENNDNPARVVFLGLCLANIRHFFGDKVAIAAIDNKTLVENNISSKDVEKSEAANLLKSVVGWEIGIRFTEKEPGVISASFRTRGKYDVAKIAVATGFGGGHPAAAGTTIKKPFAEALTFLLETIKSVYPELGNP